MALYKVKERSFINNHIAEPGSEVEYDGIPAANLEPLDKDAKAAAQDAADAGVPTAIGDDIKTTVGPAK